MRRRGSTISARRRAPSGAIVMRSSMPSACVVDASSKDTGWASSRASASIALHRRSRARSSAVLGRPAPRREPLRQAGERRLQHLQRALGRARQRRGERDPQEVERRREGHDVEVPRRDDSPTSARRPWGCPGGRSAPPRACPRVVERVAGGAEHLRERRETSADPGGCARLRAPRASCPRAVRGAARSSSASPGCGRASRHLRVHEARVGRERLEVERARDVEGVEQRLAVRHRQRCEPRRERVVVHQHSASPAASSKSSEQPLRRDRRSGRDPPGPTEPSTRTRGARAAFSASTTSCASSGRTPVSPCANPLASFSIVARTPSFGALGPWATRWPRISSRLKRACSSSIAKRFRIPTPVENP